MVYDIKSDSWQEFRVAQGILIRDGAVLLSANRWYRDRDPVWTLPGGRAEPRESSSDALLREFNEETGLTVEIESLAYVVEARSSSARRHFLTCVFAVSELAGSLSCEGDPSVVDVRFVPVAELRFYLPAPSLGTPLITYLEQPHPKLRYWYFPEYG